MKKSFSLFALGCRNLWCRHALALLLCTGAAAQSYQWAKNIGGINK